jgi:hypothetical protein
MAQTLTELREEVATALTDVEIPATSFIPEQIYPPLAVVGPGTPYLQPKDFKTYDLNQLTVRIEVTLIVALVANDQTTKELDELVVTALKALCKTHDWNLENVGEPGFIQGTNFFGVNITITNRLEVN